MYKRVVLSQAMAFAAAERMNTILKFCLKVGVTHKGKKLILGILIITKYLPQGDKTEPDDKLAVMTCEAQVALQVICEISSK